MTIFIIVESIGTFGFALFARIADRDVTAVLAIKIETVGKGVPIVVFAIATKLVGVFKKAFSRTIGIRTVGQAIVVVVLPIMTFGTTLRFPDTDGHGRVLQTVKIGTIGIAIVVVIEPIGTQLVGVFRIRRVLTRFATALRARASCKCDKRCKNNIVQEFRRDFHFYTCICFRRTILRGLLNWIDVKEQGIFSGC